MGLLEKSHELPRWLSGKESACSAGHTGDAGSTSGSERSPGGGNGDLLQYSCLENPMDRGAWWATYSPWGNKESDMTDQLSTHTHRQDTAGKSK